MAVVALTSAKGAPGVTTSALAIALAWPRPVLLLEADVAGGSSILAGYLRGALRHDRGLVELALAHRRGGLVDALHEASIQLPNSQARLIAGLISPAQAASLQPVWETLAGVLRALDHKGTDVIIDAGRVGGQHGPAALLREADLTLLVTRTTLPAVAATRARTALLREEFTNQGTGADALALLLVGEGQPYSARELKDGVKTPVAAALAWDPVNAEVFSLGATAGRKFQSSSLVRSVHAASASLRTLIAARQERLAPGLLVQDGDRTHA